MYLNKQWQGYDGEGTGLGQALRLYRFSTLLTASNFLFA
jgi:hypothetical protein